MEQDKRDDELLRPVQVAERYGVHAKTLPKWVEKQRIPAPVVQRPRYTRWSRNEVAAHIEQMKRGETAEAAR